MYQLVNEHLGTCTKAYENVLGVLSCSLWYLSMKHSAWHKVGTHISTGPMSRVCTRPCRPPPAFYHIHTGTQLRHKIFMGANRSVIFLLVLHSQIPTTGFSLSYPRDLGKHKEMT